MGTRGGGGVKTAVNAGQNLALKTEAAAANPLLVWDIHTSYNLHPTVKLYGAELTALTYHEACSQQGDAHKGSPAVRFLVLVLTAGLTCT